MIYVRKTFGAIFPMQKVSNFTRHVIGHNFTIQCGIELKFSPSTC